MIKLYICYLIPFPKIRFSVIASLRGMEFKKCPECNGNGRVIETWDGKPLGIFECKKCYGDGEIPYITKFLKKLKGISC